ncbi:hybrid sensor histidine kinase/response regulator [Cognatiluteimonas weifangensis]|uniref:histidine kinase n=1 Tax=Cognatiluteimonas weifangensis TaxID=2303539 RepID=A0A372DQS0_9GAMM|nr:hybrid sensor histidine kinase/response regulator [Luteimonas weifangensis]RFP61896.1 sensor histidine kinase [Luteimonas weifangensis]
MAAAYPPSPASRWLALGAAAGAALALALERFGLSGPWTSVALLLALLALFALSAYLHAAHLRDGEWQRADERARRGEAAIIELQREIDRHTQLEQQLLQAKQTAESAVLAKGEFLATMSHEIRTPLNGVVPMLDLLLHAASLAPDHRELVRTAYASSQQLLRIVDDILDYSKLEADRLELETTTFNLRELLETVIQLMERPAEAKGLRLHLHIDPAVRLPVRGDPVRLRQVLGNLISNAVKFTERGSVSVSVARIGESTAQHQLRFEVRDTGIGIAPEAQARLFQAFSQADASTTRLYGGTGLGLAICRRIVDLMGGRIGVQSEPGRGATFRFDIPLLKVQGDMPARELDFAGGRLLLLSADARLRLRLSMLLPNWGLRVTAVETTQEALDRLRAAAAQGEPWAYGIVLADLAGMRNTALALHRNLERHAIYGDVRLVCLQGEDPLSEELLRSATVLARNAPDADLRAALTPKPASAEDRPGRQPGAGASAPAQPGSAASARVLLVEDNPVNLMVGQRLLNVLGVDCDTAHNGEAALLRMQASRYDLVLMDCQMPVMDGYTATRRWRDGEHAAQDGHHLPIIAMTANAMAGDRQKCIDAGMDDYLAKPVTRAELERCLHRWWRPRPPADAAAPPVATRPPAAAPAAAVPAAAAIPRATAAAAPAIAPSAPPPVPLKPPAAPVATAASGDSAAAIDQEILDELRAVLGNEVERLITVFLEATPPLIARLEAAALAPDYAALREAAHTLKSSSANLGAMALSTAARRVELGARTQTLDRPAVAVALVAREFARASQALRAALPA